MARCWATTSACNANATASAAAVADSAVKHEMPRPKQLVRAAISMLTYTANADYRNEPSGVKFLRFFSLTPFFTDSYHKVGGLLIKFAHNLFYSYLCIRKFKDRIIRELSSSFSHRESLSNEGQSRRRKEDNATNNCRVQTQVSPKAGKGR